MTSQQLGNICAKVGPIVKSNYYKNLNLTVYALFNASDQRRDP